MYQNSMSIRIAISDNYSLSVIGTLRYGTPRYSVGVELTKYVTNSMEFYVNVILLVFPDPVTFWIM